MDGLTPAALQALFSGDEENFKAASTPGGIERQEKEGQQQLVESQMIPKESPIEELESLGFKIIGEHDDIFYNAEFPEGWQRKATDHSMWSKIIDDKGRERVSVFYKAAFYDRSAHASLIRRFAIDRNWGLKNEIQYQVTDCGEVLFETDVVEHEEKGREYFDLCDKVEKTAVKWLEEKYPDWKNPLKYWE